MNSRVHRPQRAAKDTIAAGQRFHDHRKRRDRHVFVGRVQDSLTTAWCRMTRGRERVAWNGASSLSASWTRRRCDVMRRHGDLRHIYGEAPLANEAAAAYFQKQMRSVERTLEDGRPHLLGDRFTAADMLLSTCLTWAVRYGVPVTDRVTAYNAGITARPAYQRALESNRPPSSP